MVEKARIRYSRKLLTHESAGGLVGAEAVTGSRLGVPADAETVVRRPRWELGPGGRGCLSEAEDVKETHSLLRCKKQRWGVKHRRISSSSPLRFSTRPSTGHA